ncbi:[4Fe-4S] proteins maturation [Coemansia erecta]|uniref:[4Fe-4S] proteins maturation n=1 Tax=Coemansia erecta TaxID=147472 RepID=A0A9W8CR84_9FUNG|nr:[4Fe-4S] proteins maturation [Coemansia erecta]
MAFRMSTTSAAFIRPRLAWLAQRSGYHCLLSQSIRSQVCAAPVSTRLSSCRSSSSSSITAADNTAAAAAKYTLRKLTRDETVDIENKISNHGKETGDVAPQSSTADNVSAATSSEADSIQLTDSAIERLKYLSDKRQKTQYLRLRVDSGGCYGFSYMLDMTEDPEENDIVLDRKGAKMVIDGCSLPLVRGATIDWQDRLIGQAFLVVANPNSSGGCGCGASFEIKLD